MNKQLIVTEADLGQRLDKFLQKQLPEITRSHMKKWILKGYVFINGQNPSVHQLVKPGDVIIIDKPTSVVKKLPKIKVLAKGKGYIAIDKPANLSVHPNNQYHEEVTLLDWLAKKYPKTKAVGDPQRPGLVHRLDKFTSGVMLVATTQEMYEHLKKQFAQRTIEKTYLALVYGNLQELQGEIKSYIGRSSQNQRMASRPHPINSKDKEAITAYEVVKRYTNFDFIKAQPKTGRTHQIRVQFYALGHPIVGDNVYKHNDKNLFDLDQNFLHAHELVFQDLKGKTKTITSPLPKTLQQIVKNYAR